MGFKNQLTSRQRGPHIATAFTTRCLGRLARRHLVAPPQSLGIALRHAVAVDGVEPRGAGAGGAAGGALLYDAAAMGGTIR